MTMHELEDEYLALLTMLEEDPEEADEAAIHDTISMILLDIDEKAEGYGKVLKQLQADAAMLKEEKLRIAKKQATIESNIERLRGALLHAMLLTGRNKIKTPLFSFSTSTRWKPVLDVPADAIPEQFWKPVRPEADMKAIEKWLKEFNPEISGNNCTTCEWAHLEQVDSLTVR